MCRAESRESRAKTAVATSVDGENSAARVKLTTEHTADTGSLSKTFDSSAFSVSSCDGEFLAISLRVTTPNVLVVDDEPLVRWSIAETLEESGYHVTKAGDALSALEALDGKAVVLLDLKLPDSSDLGVLSMMRRLSPTTPVILMTAYGSDALRIQARDRGAYAVIDKPFDMSTLPALVSKALR